MRGFLILTVSVLVAVGVGIGVEAGVGSSPTSSPPSAPIAQVQRDLASLGRSPYLQASFALAGTAGAVRSNDLSVDLEMASGSPSMPLSASKPSLGALQLSVLARHQSLFELRVVNGSHVYFETNLTAVSGLSGISASTRSLISSVAPLVDGRWFSLPNSVGKQITRQFASGAVVPSSPSDAQKAGTAFKQFVGALENGSTFRTTELSGNEQQVAITTPTSVFASALANLLRMSGKSTGAFGVTPAKIDSELSQLHGVAHLFFVSSPGDQLQSAEFKVQDRSGAVGVGAAFAHVAQAITAPPNATPLPQSLISGALGALQNQTTGL